MRMNMTADTVTFLVTVSAGIVCGILFDIFKVFGMYDTKKRLIPFYDMIFVIAAAFIVMTAFYIFNSYQLRAFMFLGIFLGVILYFLTLSSVVIKILKQILKFFKFIFKILLTPAVFLYKILVVYFLKPFTGKLKRIKGCIKLRIIKKNRGRITHGKTKKRRKKKIRFISRNSGNGNCRIAGKRSHDAT